VTLPAEGWFPDPQDAARLRWWDGRAWGESTRAQDRPVPGPVVPVLVTASGPTFSVDAASRSGQGHSWAYGSTHRRFCVFATLAVLFAIVSLVANPWGACSLVAVVAGSTALVHPGATGPWRVVGQSIGASALVVAVATGAVVLSAQLHLS
jgi:hypothetical protein